MINDIQITVQTKEIFLFWSLVIYTHSKTYFIYIKHLYIEMIMTTQQRVCNMQTEFQGILDNYLEY